MEQHLGQDINEKDRWQFLCDNADVDGRDVSLSLISAGANETMEEYKNKVIDEQLEAITKIAPDIAILEI